MTLFVDMDGVLADFDTHHETVFGFRACKKADNVDWEKVRAEVGFYENIPPMPDMLELWAFVSRFEPIVLTGVPKRVAEAPDNKRSWVRKHLGSHVPVICCPSRDKSVYCRPGDVIVDDWDKHCHLWVAKGGHWVLHITAEDSIHQLNALGFK